MKIIKKILHGQEVNVTVYDNTRNPDIAAGPYGEELVNATAERVAEIQDIADKYKQDCVYKILAHDFDDDDDFLDLVEEEDYMEVEGYGVEERYVPLDELLTDLRFEYEEEEDY